MFGEAKDQFEDHQEEEPNNEAEDEEESSGELEEDPEEDPIEEVHQKQLEETILDPELFNYKCDQSGEPHEKPSEAAFSEKTSEGEDPGEDPEYDLAEEVEQPLQETILAPELDKKPGETSVNEVPVCSLESFYNCYGDQTREVFEELSEASSSKQTSDHDSDECDRKSGSVKSNEKKRCLDVASGVSTPLLCYQSLKKCKQEESPASNPKLGSGTSGLELNDDFVTTVSPIDKSASKEEDKGSSGKRRHSRWGEPQHEGDGIKDFQTCKRRKTRWSSDDTQIKMLGPLQLPDFTKDFLVESEKEPEIQRLTAELSEINKKLRGPLHDDRSEEARSPSPEPIYNNLGIRINTQEVRTRQKLVEKRQNIISKLIKSNPTFNPPPDYKPPKLFKKLYIPVQEYPEYNFVGLIIGPRGNTQKRMESETGAKILLRGKGSSKTPNKSASVKEDLHVYIEADNQSSLDAAVAKVEKLLIPIEGRNEHKRAQLKELSLLNEATRNENVCTVCGDEEHRQYACPNLQSTFDVNSCDTWCSDNHLKPAFPSVALSPQTQGSGFSCSLSSTQNRQWRSEKKSVMDNLYVGNLPKSIDDNRLSELFSPFGKITEAKVIKDRTTGSSRGYGFVKFENVMDAAVATRLNGSRMDGRVLKVKVAGLLSNAESPGQNLLPQCPAPSGISQSFGSQTNCCGPLHFMLPEHPTSFYDSCSKNMFSSSINSQHCDLKKDLSCTPPSYISSPSYFSNSGNMHLSCNFSDQSLFSSGNSITQNPCDPCNSGSQFQSHFMTPTFEKSALPNPEHRSEDINSFRSSLLKMDFRTFK